MPTNKKSPLYDDGDCIYRYIKGLRKPPKSEPHSSALAKLSHAPYLSVICSKGFATGCRHKSIYISIKLIKSKLI